MSNTETENPTTPELVEAYLNQRNLLRAREEEVKTELAGMKETLDEFATKLLAVCNEQNADSIKTAAGTVSRRVQSRFWASDWDAMYGFINENDAPFLLERRIHNGNMQQFMSENPEAHPPGLQLDSKYVIQVRKPTAK